MDQKLLTKVINLIEQYTPIERYCITKNKPPLKNEIARITKHTVHVKLKGDVHPVIKTTLGFVLQEELNGLSVNVVEIKQ